MIALVHDIAECVVGDLTPSDPVSPEEKHQMEMEAMSNLVKQLPTGRLALEFYNGLERYEAQDPGDSEAKLAKDLDKFDMIMQAYEYEERSRKGPFLQDFFDSTVNVFQVPKVKAWSDRLRHIRGAEVKK